MAIEYSKVGWDVAPYKYANPDNMNKMDKGIKDACDGVDAINALDLNGRFKQNGYGKIAGGRNIFNPSSILHGNYENDTYTFSVGAYKAFEMDFKANTQYTFSGYVKNSVASANQRLHIYYTDGSNGNILMNASTAEAYKTWTSDSGKTISSVMTDYGTATGGGNYSIRNFQIEEGTTATTYEPYYESNAMLTEDAKEIASLKYLGWTVPREMPIKNVDKSNSMTQRVGRVDLGTLSWSGSGTFQSSDLISKAKAVATSVMPNMYSGGITVVKADNFSSADTAICIGADGRLWAKKSGISDATAFRSAMSGVYLYYELSSEVQIAEGHEALSTQEVTLGNGEATAYKSGNVVTINVDLFNGLVTASGSTIGTLPVGWRPKKQMLSACACGSLSNIVGRLYANSDGVVGVASNTETYYARGSITFIV